MTQLIDRFAIFVTADKNYAFQAFVTLQSVKRYFPEARLFVIGDYDESAEEAIFFARHGIRYIRDPWLEGLRPYTPYKHMVTYSMLSGPQLLHDLGFSYCLGLDADVICVKPFGIEGIFHETKNFAGIANQKKISSNWSSREDVSKALTPSPDKSDLLTNPNAGILFFSCTWADNFKLREKAELILKDHGFDILSGDQGLLAAVIFKYSLRYNTLGAEFNLRLDNRDDRVHLRELDFPFLVHFTGPKPWGKKRLSLLPLPNRKEKKHWWRVWLELQSEALLLWGK